MLAVAAVRLLPLPSALPEAEVVVANPEPCSKGECRLSPSLTAESLADDARLDAAFAWLCKRRNNWPAGADVWAFRRRWPQEKARLQQELQALRGRLALQGNALALWAA
ncbi:hypothetical protein [Candidatus Entotheonella palauensis]|uniref:Uncharacterized protein n=1 Tax=Candidatus Entotheonella gemina TaxID=1429439 RepID=W4LER0_9BACT|nr:hypothetical protein [Candidatus Entotheonella palauensis]ETW96482.1 MAG: hypothetical protein ETSY2_46315 [Candidatus Entotheonella gemina]